MVRERVIQVKIYMCCFGHSSLLFCYDDETFWNREYYCLLIIPLLLLYCQFVTIVGGLEVNAIKSFGVSGFKLVLLEFFLCNYCVIVLFIANLSSTYCATLFRNMYFRGFSSFFGVEMMTVFLVD